MNDSPLVSVILPSYNHSKYVKQAILSVVNQSYPHIQLIVIDDGSTDDSVNIITLLQKEYNFVFITQSNCGVVNTIRRGLGLATGRYISPFSSDDLYEHFKIERLVELLEGHPDVAVAYGRIGLIDSCGNSIKEIVEPYRSGNIYRNLLRGDFSINGLAALVRKEIYVSAFQHDSYVDDLPVWLQIAKNNKYIFCKEILAQYRRHDNHLSGNLLKMLQSEEEILLSHKDRPEYAEAIKRWNLRWFYNCTICHKKLAVQKYLVKAISTETLIDPRLYWGLVRLAFFWREGK